jgi:hypothetical protein
MSKKENARRRATGEKIAPHRVRFVALEFRRGLRYYQVVESIIATFGVARRTAEIDIKRYYQLESEAFDRELGATTTRAVAGLWRALAIAERNRDAAAMAKVIQVLMETTGLQKAKKIKIELERMKAASQEDLDRIIEEELAKRAVASARKEEQEDDDDDE